MLTKLYIETTNPKTSWDTFFSSEIIGLIILSLVFHTILYAAVCNMFSFIFFGKLLTRIVNTRLIICLFVFMSLGYIGRFIHVKQVYKDYNYDEEKTKEYINTHYNSWIFLG